MNRTRCTRCGREGFVAAEGCRGCRTDADLRPLDFVRYFLAVAGPTVAVVAFACIAYWLTVR